MNKKIHEQVMKEFGYYKKDPIQKFLLEDVKKMLSRTIELMEEDLKRKEKEFQKLPHKTIYALEQELKRKNYQYGNLANKYAEQKADFRKMIENWFYNELEIKEIGGNYWASVSDYDIQEILAKLGDNHSQQESSRRDVSLKQPAGTSKGCGKKFVTRDLLLRRNRDGSKKYSKPRKAICGKYGEHNAFIDLCPSCKKKTSTCICGHREDVHYAHGHWDLGDKKICKCKKFQEVGG